MNTDTVPLAPKKRTADEIRTLLMQKFEAVKPSLAVYREYATQATALNQEYHEARFKEFFPASKMSELTLIGTLDSRETPTSLDNRLAHLQDVQEVTVKQIIFDRAAGKYYLYV